MSSHVADETRTLKHFPFLRDGRTDMQQATLGKSGSEAASQLQGRIARAFSSNSLVNTMDMTAAIQYILTAAQLTFPEFHFETEAKVDFPSACI